MNLKARIGVAAHPDIRLHARLSGFDFGINGEAAINLATSTIHAEIGEVPLRLAIPFHRHRRVVAGTIGPFTLHIHPADADIRIANVQLSGSLGGGEGIVGDTHIQGSCRAEVDIEGETPGKILKAAIEGVFEQ
jgi:hypothetical protein